MRKTIKVADLTSMVNHALRASTCSRDTRLGMASVLGNVLSTAGAYGGFRYLRADEVPAGQLPGITGEGPWEFPDDSRREYHCKARG